MPDQIALNSYVDLLIDEAARARSEAQFDRLCDRIERALGIGPQQQEAAQPFMFANGRQLFGPFTCPRSDCTAAFADLLSWRQHLDEHERGAEVAIAPGDGWAPPAGVGGAT